MKLIPGQTPKEKQYYEKIKQKNKERTRLPRGKFIPK
jgi:hypothetical protein